MSAVIVFSGGQDSTTCLYWAKTKWKTVLPIHFQYGQKHSVESRVCVDICRTLKLNLKIVDISFLPELVNSALTSDGDVDVPHADNSSLPASFVPNRNALFLTLAHAYAQKMGAGSVVTGVCQTDYSGYPDCRALFINLLSSALNEGSETLIPILTPLMFLDKGQIFELAQKLDCLSVIVNMSHTCYNGERVLNPWGRGCGQCAACQLRKKGWEAFQSRQGVA